MGAHRDDLCCVDATEWVGHQVVDTAYQHAILRGWESPAGLVQRRKGLQVWASIGTGGDHAVLPIRAELDSTFGVACPRCSGGALVDSVLGILAQPQTV